MRTKFGAMRWSGLLVFALVAAACSSSANAGQAGSDSFSIVAPSDGATMTSPFTVRVDAGVPLGDPSTGEHHVHLCFDGADCDSEYTLVYGSTFKVGDLSPGEHTIEASLRNADHSDAGATDSITVTVRGGSGGSQSDAGNGGSSGSGQGGFGY